MSQIVIWSLFIAGSAAVALAVDAAEEANQPSLIVIPADPTPVERHAAEELARYIGLMTTRALPIVGEDQPRPDGRALVVGRTRSNLALHDPETWPRDTIHLGYGPGDVAVLGQGPQGTLFAAYALLRDQGCRWYMPDNAVEDVVPGRAHLVLPDVPHHHTPSFLERGWHPHPASPGTWRVHYHDWAVRNNLNTFRGAPTFDYGPQRGHGLEIRGGHTLCALIPSGDFPLTAETFEAHPDWYPLADGRRVTQYSDGRPVQACLANPAVVEEVARKAVAYFREHPDCHRFSVSHADEPTWWCECDACRAMDGPHSTWQANDRYDAYGVRSKAGPGPMSDRWVKFVNQVARIVGRSMPDRFISFFAYGSTVAPPRGDGWHLEPNLLVEFAHGDGACLLHAEDDPDCPPNAAMNRWLSGWASRGNPIVFYDYPPNGGNFDIPAGFVRRYQPLIQWTRRTGVTGWGGEGQGSWAGSGIWQYVKARLLWDADADVDALVAEFCRDLYGPAAATMARFYAALEEHQMALPGHPVWGAWLTRLPPEALVHLYDLLVEAADRADSPRTRRHVTMVRVTMNALIMAWLEAESNAPRSAALPFSYAGVRAEAVGWLEQYEIPVTDAWRDRVVASAYRPPLAALRGTTLVALADGWRFRLDPADEGGAAGWQAIQDTAAAPWRDIRVDRYWTEQAIDYHGVAWYVNTVAVPDGARGRLWLLFGMIDGDAEIWLDGRSVGALSGDPWDKPKAFDVTAYVKPGAPARIAVRVAKDRYAAGINGFVRLVADDQ